MMTQWTPRRSLWPVVAGFAVCFATVGMAPALADDAQLAAGEALYSQCAACHEVGAGARNKVGPHLDGIIGRIAGTVDAFRYSRAMIEAGENGLVWDAETLGEYLEKPRTFIRGNRMSYRGMPDGDDRAALIAWLGVASVEAPSDDLAVSASVSDSEAPGFTEIILEIEGDVAFGEYLAGECVTCHQATGQAEGIPSIVGIPKDYFVRSLVEYKTNVRQNEVMKLRVQNLGNEEIAALAAYFATLEPQ